MPPLGTTAGPFKFLPFVGGAISTGAGFAVGTVTAPTLRPILQDLENRTWTAHPVRPLDVEALAAIVAEDVEQREWGLTEAAKTGYGTENFDAALGEALNAPGLGPLFEAWRRDLITDAAFEHGLRKAKLEPRWDAPLRALKLRLLSLDDLANARQQGYITEAEQKEQSALQGWDDHRAELAFLLKGLPPGVETGLEMLRRSIIDEGTFAEIVREGHTKTKYTDELLELRDRVLTASDYASLWLRGWITEGAAKAGGELTGYDAEAMDLLYLNRGRPATTRQAFIGYTRGGRVAGRQWDERETHKRAVEQSNIRTEWEPVLWAQRYTYPSAFVLRNLTQSGDITEADAKEVLIFEGWEPGFAAKVSQAWATGGGASADPHIKKAQVQLWGTAHRSYLTGELTDADASTALEAAGVTTAAVPEVLTLWAHEANITRKRLTQAQIKSAYKKSAENAATGQPWTRDEAIAALGALGLPPLQAQDYLNI